MLQDVEGVLDATTSDDDNHNRHWNVPGNGNSNTQARGRGSRNARTGTAGEAFFSDVLAHPTQGLHLHLKVAFGAAVDAQVGWVRQCKMDAKQSGVLPPFLRFPAIVDRLDATAKLPRVSVVAAGMGESGGAGGVGGVEGSGSGGESKVAQSSSASSHSSGSGSGSGSGSSSGGSRVAKESSTGYDSGNMHGVALAKIGQAMFSWLEGTAASNDKYRDIVRMENYYFFVAMVGARHVPALLPAVEDAQRRYVL